MKKSINISISGIAFTFEHDAYQKLNDYINLLVKAYSAEDAAAEIIADIEARISELVLSWQSVNDEIVTLGCIEEIIEQMGTPDIETSSNTKGDIEGDGAKHADNSVGSHIPRRLYRNPEGSKFGGVVNGIATYFRQDVTLFRIMLLVAVLIFSIASEGIALFGFGVTYIVLWIVIPMAKNARQKMEMSGRPITAESLRRNIGVELDAINTNTSEVNAKVGSLFSQILLVVAKIIRFVVISISMVVGVALVLMLISALGLTIFSFANYQGLVSLFASQNEVFVILSLALSVIVPLVIFICVIAKLTLSLKFNKILLTTLSILWVVSWGVTTYIVIDSSLGLLKSHSAVKSEATYHLSSNELNLNPADKYCYGYDDFDFRDGVIRKKINIYLVESSDMADSTITISCRVTAKAASISQAEELYNTLEVDYSVDNNNFNFDEYIIYAVDNHDKFDNRRVHITITHPKSMKINNHYHNYIYYRGR